MHVNKFGNFDFLDGLSYNDLKDWLIQNLDFGRMENDMAAEFMKLLEVKRIEHRAKLHLIDPLTWCEDKMGLDPKGIKWSLNGGAYDNHVWDSRIHHQDINDYDGRKIFPYKPCPDPLWQFGIQLAAKQKRIAMPSSTGVGKTFYAAYLVYWFLDTFGPEAKVIFFANKLDQLRVNIGAEIENLVNRFKRIHPKAAYHRGNVRLYVDNTDGSARELWSARGYGAQVKSGDDAAGGVKGSHSANQLFIFEEAQSAEPAIIKSILDGATGSNNLVIFLGNPIGQHDQLYKICTELSNVTWISISSLDHPNIVLADAEYIPGAVDQAQLDIKLEDVGGDTNHGDYAGPVRGIFPLTSANAIISSRLAEMTKQYLEYPEDAPIFHDHTDVEKEIEGWSAFWYRTARPDYIRWCFVSMDLAGDAVDGDWHVATFFDRIAKRPFGFVRMRGNRTDFFNEVVKWCNKFSTPWLAKNIAWKPMLSWERNFHSPTRDGVIGDYPNKYRPHSMDMGKSKRQKVEGWHTNKKTRIEMQERLKEWLALVESGIEEDDQSRLFCHPLHYELTKFVTQKKNNTLQNLDDKTIYAAAASFNDDMVMSLAQVLAIDAEYAAYPPMPITPMPKDSNHILGKRMLDTGEQSTESVRSSTLPVLDRYKPKNWNYGK